MILSLSVSMYFPSLYSCSLPNTIGTGKNLQYFVKSSLIFAGARYSSESLSINKTTSVPTLSFSIGVIEYSGLPSHSHLTACASFWYDFV